MTDPVFRYPTLTQTVVGDDVTLDAEQSHHAVRVRRFTAGRKIDLVDGKGLRAAGKIVSADASECRVLIEKIVTETYRGPDISLIQARATDRRDEAGVEAAIQLGVARVIPWLAERSVAKWKPNTRERWQAIADSAAQVARTSLWPEVLDPVDTGQLCAYIKAGGGQERTLVCHENASETITAVLTGWAASKEPPARVNVIIGPEGGITDEELTQFAAVGASQVLLTPTVLRVSVASAAALSVIGAYLGRWQAPVIDEPTGHAVPGKETKGQ